MLQDTEIATQVEVMTVTSAATEAVRGILAQRQLEGYALRVYVAGSSCCGVQFGMALDNNIRASDTTLETEGIKVVVDDQSINYLRGAKIDFVTDGQHGTGFLVDSPSAKKESGSCSSGGCGDGCGGSCGS